MKFILLAFFSFFPILQVNSSTPKSVTCTRTEYREEYIPGTKSSPGYVRNYEIDVEIPCGGAKEDDCTDGKIVEHYLEVELVVLCQKRRSLVGCTFSAVTGAAIGCQVDGG